MVGVGKRLRVDSMVNTDSDGGSVKVRNLRQTYAVTFGRLSWQYTRLNDTYNASCNANAQQDCSALEYALPGDAKRIVVGPTALPLRRLQPLDFTNIVDARPNPLQLVRVNEQYSDSEDTTGDILMAHNADTIGTLTRPDVLGVCTAVIRAMRLQLVLNNHLYIEHPLLATYTAGMFLLFQDAVVRDVVRLSATAQTLAFDGNVQRVDVRLSIPASSAWITFAGCIVLVAALVLALLWPVSPNGTENDPLAAITDPHSVARVLLDEKTFPPFALHRRVVSGSSKQEHNDAESFEIRTLTLRHEDEHDRVAASA